MLKSIKSLLDQGKYDEAIQELIKYFKQLSQESSDQACKKMLRVFKNLVGEARCIEAVELLIRYLQAIGRDQSPYYNPLILMLGKMNEIKRQQDNDIIGRQEATAARTKILTNFLKILDKLEESPVFFLN